MPTGILTSALIGMGVSAATAATVAGAATLVGGAVAAKKMMTPQKQSAGPAPVVPVVEKPVTMPDPLAQQRPAGERSPSCNRSRWVAPRRS